jgi:hypothetical protein
MKKYKKCAHIKVIKIRIETKCKKCFINKTNSIFNNYRIFLSNKMKVNKFSINKAKEKIIINKQLVYGGYNIEELMNEIIKKVEQNE